MKKAEVEVGKCYIAKVSGVLAVVEIISEHERKGWNARNLKTRRNVRITTAGRLRRPASDSEVVEASNPHYR